MRYTGFALCLVVSMAVGADSDESAAVEPETTESTELSEAEAEADAEIREIEKSVSGADDVEEFIPKKPLSADKAIALPSDI